MANTCSVSNVSNPRSLDDLRPRKLWQVVGNEPVTARLSPEMKNGLQSNLLLFHGPTGSGKTTLARILAASQFCKQPDVDGNPCGNGCSRCRDGLDQIVEYWEWSGADLNAHWSWWADNFSRELLLGGHAFFLDEAQDLDEKYQKVLLKQLEWATNLFIMATTHINKINDALVSRFQPNVFEMRRPTPDQATQALVDVCGTLEIQISKPVAYRVVASYGCDMRKCTNFAYAAKRQSPSKIITDEFVTLVLGTAPAAQTTMKARSRAPAKL
jgi:DNA polymerase-3 subunit gamma/tau